MVMITHELHTYNTVQNKPSGSKGTKRSAKKLATNFYKGFFQKNTFCTGTPGFQYSLITNVCYTPHSGSGCCRIVRKRRKNKVSNL